MKLSDLEKVKRLNTEYRYAIDAANGGLRISRHDYPPTGGGCPKMPGVIDVILAENKERILREYKEKFAALGVVVDDEEEKEDD